MKAFDLTGKVAIVTGATRGIGRSIAEHLAAAGARVVVSSRTAQACDDVAASIRANGGQALGIAANISKKQEIEALVQRTLAQWGRVDVLVANAATNPYYGPMAGASDEVFDKVMRNNVQSNMWLANLVLPGMAERKDGAVIFVGSIGGFRGRASLGIYGMSKAAEMQMARCMALEWGRHNIRINCIAPGLIRTDFSRAIWENPKLLAEREALLPLGRIGEPDDIGGIAVLLASKAGAFITGQVITADGGETT
ncbi:SDR family NAD(P)-dependent oxidoreductase [Caenimonas sp. SL110]|uniref:SDR family NAD(P)-dependent oxidoreductase n=1 Tax=Caenimonas sp. SL110 TaxID=1450524 RepID=UPI000653B857|nr:SDR family oxidoreductase [Caenimonas sp. SL110]